MPAFDKNSVQVDHAYAINPIREETVEMQPCPRCGCTAARKHRSDCMSCGHRIPPVTARNSWEKNMYAAEFLDPKAKEGPNFKLGRHKSAEFMRMMRKVALNVGILAFALTALPHVCQMALGPEKYEKVKAEAATLFTGASSGHMVAGALHKDKL